MSQLFLLATEAATSGDGMTPRTIAVIVLIVAMVGFAIAYYIVGPGRRRKGPRQRADIPLAMRPYHSDEELETTGIERAMAWGVALTMFMALFLPVYWALEPVRIEDKQDEYYNRDVEKGRELFAEACASCHGTNAEGGTAPNPPGYESDAPWPAPQLNNIVARYEDNENVLDVEHFITTTVRRGRPGTPMPAWSAAFNGPMNDQEIDWIVRYILSIQTGEAPAEAQAFVGKSGDTLFQEHCARCHGPNAEGRVGPSLVEAFDRYGWDGSDDTLNAAKNSLFTTIKQGRIVPTGASMPAFEDVLTDSAIQRVLDYLQTIQKRG